MEVVLFIVALSLRIAIVVGVGFLIARWGAVEAIRHVLRNESRLISQVMLSLLKSARFREELKGLIAEALASAGTDEEEPAGG